jgi:ATP-binding cassette subfamily B protein
MRFLNKRFIHYHQFDQMDCAATCLKMVSRFYEANYDIAYLRELLDTTRQGVNLKAIRSAALQIGLKTLVGKGTLESLVKEHVLPAILYWNPDHYVVLYKIEKGSKGNHFYIADPAHTKFRCSEEIFRTKWVDSTDEQGLVIFFEPEDDFKKKFSVYLAGRPSTTSHFIKDYLKAHKKSVLVILLITICSALFNLAFPILTQQIVDKGIPQKDFSLIFLLLVFQIVAFISSALFDLIKGRVTYVVTTRINIQVLNRFLIKLTRLSVRYFDNKVPSDILQRITDHNRIERFLTTNIVATLFSLFNFLFYTILILKYDYKIFEIFMGVTVFSVIWMFSFIQKRKSIEYKRFDAYKESSNSSYEIVYGMKELKLNNAQLSKVEDWNIDQQKIFDINKTSMLLEQRQNIGNVFITQSRSAFVTFYCAYLVINKHITMGEMLSISFMLGQLSSPFTQFFEFIKGWNEAFFSFERINEVNERPDEDEESEPRGKKIKTVTNFESIKVTNLSFKYDRYSPDFILNDINIEINRGQKIAFVGNSGSGKTTLMKLLLRFYEPSVGSIMIDDSNLSSIVSDNWRERCGVVMQDGYIFSATIKNNIALNSRQADIAKIKRVARLANIHDFIESQPKKYETKIGGTGVGLSGGQIQRLLIARALYKDPDILFFDEATSSLDTENERLIMENINEISLGKTLIVVAHRLSTVKNADIIYVFNQGRIVEKGSHDQLLLNQGYYYQLISNQLELSS